MYKMTLRSTAREECGTVLLVKPLVKVTHLAFFKTKAKVNGKNRVATGNKDWSVTLFQIIHPDMAVVYFISSNNCCFNLVLWWYVLSLERKKGSTVYGLYEM